jgi:hypothetical protein
MPPSTVSAVPFLLLDLSRRTAPDDAAVASGAAALDGLLVGAPAAAPGLGAAVLAHVGRASAVTARAAATGLALLVAGGAAGAFALALAAEGAPTLSVEAAAGVLAAALGLHAEADAAVERPAASPVAVAALAAVLGIDVVAAVAARFPALVGPIDGMPIELRYAANRVLADRSSNPAIRALAVDGHQLLYVDPARGHAAEVVGDLTDAEHVAVVVPGMANDVARFATILDKAAALRTEAASQGEDLVTIAWLGYDSPTFDVVVDDEARVGGAHLARFMAGVVTGGAPAAATLTVVGHSYGTLVTGHAMRAGLDVDAVAVTGSPGMGGRSVADLRDPPVYALRAPGDYVSWTERFGTDPSDSDFGATRLSTGGVVGHSGYFDAGTESLTNLALVATGRAAEATVEGRSWFDRGVTIVDDAQAVAIDLPIDVAQRTVAVGAGVASDFADTAEQFLPDPVAGVLDGVQDTAGAALELGNGSIDFAQRVVTPDFAGDMIEDAFDWVSRGR